MPAEMQAYAKGVAVEAIEKSFSPGKMALFIKTSFTEKYGGGWSSIVDKNCFIGWALYTPAGGNYTYFKLQEWSFGIFGGY